MPSDLTHSRLMKTVQNLAGLVGIGLVCVDDPDYGDLCQAYRTISSAYRRCDFTTIATTFDRDYHMIRPDGIKLTRLEVEEQLRSRLQSQVQTDYREEPAHVVIRGNRAQVATRIYSTTICRKNGKLLELKERGEHLTLWTKSNSGWKRVRTKIRNYEQNSEWVTEPENPILEKKPRTEKYLI